MSNFLWVKTPIREQLLNSVEKIPEFGKKSKSEILEIALKEFVEKHSESQNPQTKVTLYTDQYVRAIPNLYEGNSDIWEKFFYQIKTKEDFNKFAKNFQKVEDIAKRHRYRFLD